MNSNARERVVAVKVGTSRQVVIPKHIYEAMGLVAGDYMEVTVRDGSVVMTPKTLVDKASNRLPDAHAHEQAADGIADAQAARHAGGH